MVFCSRIHEPQIEENCPRWDPKHNQSFADLEIRLKRALVYTTAQLTPFLSSPKKARIVT